MLFIGARGTRAMRLTIDIDFPCVTGCDRITHAVKRTVLEKRSVIQASVFGLVYVGTRV